ncbi:MAG: DUF1415 family protein, partial [Rhizobacter sp.]
ELVGEARRVATRLLAREVGQRGLDVLHRLLDAADAAVEQLGYAGILQVATFHPQYQFADTDPDDPTNATNRAPYPTLHLLREESVDRAAAAFPDAESIFEVNMQTMATLGAEGVARLQAQCEEDARTPPAEI